MKFHALFWVTAFGSLTSIFTRAHGQGVPAEGKKGGALNSNGSGESAQENSSKEGQGFPDNSEDPNHDEYYDSTNYTTNDPLEVESNSKIVDIVSMSPTETSPILTLASSTPAVTTSSTMSTTQSSTKSKIITNGSTFTTENSSPATAKVSSTSSTVTTAGSTFTTENSFPATETASSASSTITTAGSTFITEINSYLLPATNSSNSSTVTTAGSTFTAENSSPATETVSSTSSTITTAGSIFITEINSNPLPATNSSNSSTVTNAGSKFTTENSSPVSATYMSTRSTTTTVGLQYSFPSTPTTATVTIPTKNISPLETKKSDLPSTINTLTSSSKTPNRNLLQMPINFSGELSEEFNDKNKADIKDYFEDNNYRTNTANIASTENYYEELSENSDRVGNKLHCPEKAEKGYFNCTTSSINNIEQSWYRKRTTEKTIAMISALTGFKTTGETSSVNPTAYSIDQYYNDVVKISSRHLENISNTVNRASNKLNDSTKELGKEIDNLKVSVDALKTVVASLGEVHSGSSFGTQKRRKRVAQGKKYMAQLEGENVTISHYHFDDNGNTTRDYSSVQISEEAHPLSPSNITLNFERFKNETSDKFIDVKMGFANKNETEENEQGMTTESISDIPESKRSKTFSTTTSASLSVLEPSESVNNLATSAQSKLITNNPVVSEKITSLSDLVKFSMLQLNSSINSLITSFEEILEASNSTLSDVVKRFDISKSRVLSSADNLKSSTNQLTSLVQFIDPLAGALPAVLQLSTATAVVKNVTEQLSLYFTSIVAAKVKTMRNLSDSFSSEFNQFRNISRGAVHIAVEMSSLFRKLLKSVELLTVSGNEDPEVGSVKETEGSGNGHMGFMEYTQVDEMSVPENDGLFHPKPRKSDKDKPKVKPVNGTTNIYVNKQQKETIERKIVKARPRKSEIKDQPMLTIPKGSAAPCGNRTNTTWKTKISNFLNKDISVKIKAMLGLLGIFSWGAYIIHSVK